MSAVSDSATVATKVVLELDKVLNLFDYRRNNAEVTTETGRTYKIANVLENKDDGTWEITDRVTRGMFACHHCPPPAPQPGFDPMVSCAPVKTLPGSQWTQFTHGDDVVRIHSSLMHIFKEHPDKVPQDKLDQAVKVFFG